MAIFKKFGVLGYERIREYRNERSATYQARERLVYGPGEDAGESAQRKCGGSMGGFYALQIVNLINQENLGLSMPGHILAHSPREQTQL